MSSCVIYIRQCAYRAQMSHGTHMNESRHTYEWVRAHIWTSCVTHMNAYIAHKWVTVHIWMSHGTHMNESRHTYEWVRAHIWTSCVTHMNASRHIHENLNLKHLMSLRHLVVRCPMRGGGLGSRPKKMYGERLGDGVEYHSMKPTPRR